DGLGRAVTVEVIGRALEQDGSYLTPGPLVPDLAAAGRLSGPPGHRRQHRGSGKKPDEEQNPERPLHPVDTAPQRIPVRAREPDDPPAPPACHRRQTPRPSHREDLSPGRTVLTTIPDS